MKWYRLNVANLEDGQPYEPKPRVLTRTDMDSTDKRVAQFALFSVVILFVRTVLWVVDGVFFSHPAEVRVLSMAYFLAAGVLLWQLLEYKQLARRSFIAFCALSWGHGIAAYLTQYQVPPPEYSTIQAFEYLASMMWISLSAIFVVYLFQPHVRELFTQRQANWYQRALFFVFVAHFVFFDWRYAKELPNLNDAHSVAGMGQLKPVREAPRFFDDCVANEPKNLPKTPSESSLKGYCRCDSEALSQHCPPDVSNREQCVQQLSNAEPPKIELIKSRELCVAEHLPALKDQIFEKARRRLEEDVVKALTLTLPLDESAVGEKAQRKLLGCVTMGVLSRCQNSQAGLMYQCLVEPPNPKVMESVQLRCRKWGKVAGGEYEKLLGQALEAIRRDDLPKAISVTAKAISEGPERPEAYLLRGEAYVRASQYLKAIEDFVIVLNVSDFVPTRAKAFRLRAEAYERLGKHEQAVQDKSALCQLGDQKSCTESNSSSDRHSFWLRAEPVRAAVERALQMTGEAALRGLAKDRALDKHAPADEPVAGDLSDGDDADEPVLASPVLPLRPFSVK